MKIIQKAYLKAVEECSGYASNLRCKEGRIEASLPKINLPLHHTWTLGPNTLTTMLSGVVSTLTEARSLSLLRLT